VTLENQPCAHGNRDLRWTWTSPVVDGVQSLLQTGYFVILVICISAIIVSISRLKRLHHGSATVVGIFVAERQCDILPPDYNRSYREDINIESEVRDNEHSLICPTDRGKDPTVKSDETERVDRERGTLVQNPRKAWK
jgi:hypothetical protein